MRARRLVAALSAGAVAALPWLPGAAIAAVTPSERGWAPVFAADFTAARLPAQCAAYDGPAAGQYAGYYRPDEVQVSGGMLRLSIRRRDFGGRPFTAGGVGCYDLAQRYGRYEYRARAVPTPGVDSYVSLWPQQGGESDVTHLEVYAARERPDLPPQAHVVNGYGTGSTGRALPSTVDGFHDYRVEWSPTGLRVSIDDVVVFTDSHASARERWLGFAVNTGDQESGLADQDRLPAEFLVDWLRVYAYDPDAPAGGVVPTTAEPSATGTASSGAGADGAAAPGDRLGGGLGAFTGLAASLLVALAIAAAASAVTRRLGGRRSAHRA